MTIDFVFIMALRGDGPVRSNRQLEIQAEDLPFSQPLLQNSVIVLIRMLSSSCARVCVCVCVEGGRERVCIPHHHYHHHYSLHRRTQTTSDMTPKPPWRTWCSSSWTRTAPPLRPQPTATSTSGASSCSTSSSMSRPPCCYTSLSSPKRSR